VPGAAVMEAAPVPAPARHGLFGHKQPAQPQRAAKPAPPPNIPLLVNGKVTAQLKDVTLDTVLDIVGQRPFQRLGLDARLNGPAIATWTKGDTNTLAVDANFKLGPSNVQ